MTQKEAILDYLKKGNSLTPLEALNMFGCFRLSARIQDLEAEGNIIDSKPVTHNGKTYSSYKLVMPGEQMSFL